MAIIKCKMCGGDIQLAEDKTFGTCEYCGCTMTFPKVSDEQRAAAFNRGNYFRRIGEFDKALAVYERIVAEDEADAEAHWCCALCRFGIEYVEDPATFEWLPTCHRASFDSFLEDVDYLAALEHSDGITRRQYQKDAAKIAEVQRGILATSRNTEPYDVFISYKELDADGSRTRDSILAQEVYYRLTERGWRVFFSRISLEDVPGTQYEPYIFAALNSAKVMIVVGTSAENLNAVWVKNEWSRYLSLMRMDRSKLLIPCYRDMDPYDLPEQLSVLMSYDMGRIGFIQDLIRGVDKVLGAEKPKETKKETVVVQQSGGVNIAPILERAFMFLEDGDWNSAVEYCEKVLDLDPKNARAYLGKLMAELCVHRQEDLPDCEQPFNRSNNFQKAVRFGDKKLVAELEGYIDHINKRNETNRLTGIYNGAVEAMNSAGTEAAYKAAAAAFKTIPGFKDADSLSGECLERAEVCRKDAVYASARSLMVGESAGNYESAIKTFQTISGWKDADEQIYACQRKIEEIKAKEEADRLEAARKAEDRRIATEKAEKKLKKIISITTPIVVVCIAFVVLLTNVIIPKQKLNKAMSMLDSGDYEAAYALLEEIGNSEAIASSKYDRAVSLIDSGDYEAAYALLEEIGDNETIAKSKYDRAVSLINSENYDAAIILLQNLNYKDSEAQLERCYIGKYGEEKYNIIKNIQIGDTYKFGSYEQDNKTSNGKEEIEWIVLDKYGMSLLLTSRYALDCQQYNTSDTNITWETCSLREWLNDTFINSAFSSEEIAMIPTVTVSADKNPSYGTSPGNNTTDKVFLLSIPEVNKYFSSDEARKCVPTAYAIAQGAWKSYKYQVDGKSTCWWWLRSPGRYSDRAAFVDYYGSVNFHGSSVNRGDRGVRPALWIDLGS